MAMPFVSQKQRSWMMANKPEMAKEWEAATPKGAALPERAPKQREATRKSGRKKGLARLTRMAGLGCMVIAWFLAGCTDPPPAEVAKLSGDSLACVTHQENAARADKAAGGDCRSAVAAIGLILATDKACIAADIREADYTCHEKDGGSE
jgi:hypothetical protein